MRPNNRKRIRKQGGRGGGDVAGVIRRERLSSSRDVDFDICSSNASHLARSEARRGISSQSEGRSTRQE